MTEYKVNQWGKYCMYNPPTDTIFIGAPSFSNLSNKEINEITVDILTHEYIHKVLYDMFDVTTTQLFDAIEHYFRNDKLHSKSLNIGENLKLETYQSYIDRLGFDAFLEHYHIDNNDFNQASIICNNRLKRE